MRKNNPDRKREVNVGGQTIDLQILERMDDDTLRQAVNMLARAAGVSEKQAQRAVGNVEKLKQRLSGMSGEQIQRAVDAASPEQAGQIAELLKKAAEKEEKQ